MTRTSQKDRTHESILRVATDLVRKHGIGAASVARVMGGAGLTVGGFYAHFASKAELAAEALRQAFRENMGALFKGTDGATVAERYDLAIRRYLSRDHRDMRFETCPVPACLSEIDPGEPELRDALVEGVDELVQRLTPMFEDAPDLTARQRALATVATLIGAMALARASRGTEWSDELLLAARKLLFHTEVQGDPR